MAPALLIALPWYIRNFDEAVGFALRASQYNVVSEGRVDDDPRWPRLIAMAREVAGWPTLGFVALGTAFAFARRERAHRDASEAARHFAWMTLLGGVTAVLGLLRPAFFDARFVLPIWPAAAVCIGSRLRPRSIAEAVIAALGLGVGVVASIAALAEVPTSRIYWDTKQLVDQLAETRGIRSIGNVGDTPDWNVCKTGLMNEMRDDPGSCFVLHDLSKDSEAEIRRRLEHLDALFVLDPDALPEGFRSYAPGLNRAYDTLGVIAEDSAFEPIPVDPSWDLPPLSVYVRGRPRAEAVPDGATRAADRRGEATRPLAPAGTRADDGATRRGVPPR